MPFRIIISSREILNLGYVITSLENFLAIYYLELIGIPSSTRNVEHAMLEILLWPLIMELHLIKLLQHGNIINYMHDQLSLHKALNFSNINFMHQYFVWKLKFGTHALNISYLYNVNSITPFIITRYLLGIDLSHSKYQSRWDLPAARFVYFVLPFLKTL